jgi:hypothetical protein
MGRDTFINTARPVMIGDEVGLGTRTALYTHGAYLSALDGFPVAFAPINFGDRVWLPGATVNPGVTIGSDVVIGVGSVVTRDIPSGSLAAGVPATVIRANVFPAPLDAAASSAVLHSILDEAQVAGKVYLNGPLLVGTTTFHPAAKSIEGPATVDTELVRQQLRRHGIRFYSRPLDGAYRDWQ